MDSHHGSASTGMALRLSPHPYSCPLCVTHASPRSCSCRSTNRRKMIPGLDGLKSGRGGRRSQLARSSRWGSPCCSPRYSRPTVSVRSILPGLKIHCRVPAERATRAADGSAGQPIHHEHRGRRACTVRRHRRDCSRRPLGRDTCRAAYHAQGNIYKLLLCLADTHEALPMREEGHG